MFVPIWNIELQDIGQGYFGGCDRKQRECGERERGGDLD